MQKNFKIAMLMLCHIYPEQINDFIEAFDEDHFDFFLHVDRKSNIQSMIRIKDNMLFVPDGRRVDVRWGTYSMIQATLELINLAIDTRLYDYFWLCSGQDYPIKSISEIEEFFSNKGCNFISFSASDNCPINGYKNRRYGKRCEVVYPPWIIGKTIWQRMLKKAYCMVTGGLDYTFKVFRRIPPLGLNLFFGSQWWCLNKETIDWIIEYIKKNKEVCAFFKRTLCPDESFFQTLIMASPYAREIEPNLVYIDWEAGKSSPKILTFSDSGKMKKSGKLLARKIDSEKEPMFYRILTNK